MFAFQRPVNHGGYIRANKRVRLRAHSRWYGHTKILHALDYAPEDEMWLPKRRGDLLLKSKSGTSNVSQHNYGVNAALHKSTFPLIWTDVL